MPKDAGEQREPIAFPIVSLCTVSPNASFSFGYLDVIFHVLLWVSAFVMECVIFAHMLDMKNETKDAFAPASPPGPASPPAMWGHQPLHISSIWAYVTGSFIVMLLSTFGILAMLGTWACTCMPEYAKRFSKYPNENTSLLTLLTGGVHISFFLTLLVTNFMLNNNQGDDNLRTQTAFSIIFKGYLIQQLNGNMRLMGSMYDGVQQELYGH
jgi:hypothetical protein